MFSLTSVEQDKPFTIEQIANNMQKVFDQTHRLVILVDTTLEPDTFDQLKAEVGKEHIVNVPLAKGQKADNTPVFFIEIKEQSVFDKVKLQLVERISLHYNYDNSAYLVCGFGSSKLDNETLNDRFKKSLVLSDQKSEFLFRWYDPRVLIYLDAIFSEHQLNSLLGIFDHWHFIHPIGYFEWIKKYNEVFVKNKIYSLTASQSLALDLIEISNLVFKEAVNYPEIDHYLIQPQTILENIYQAYQAYGINNYTDLFTYGLYAELLGNQFFIHPEIQDLLTRYWNVEPANYSFKETMEFLEKEDWISIKQDLKKLESEEYV